MSFFLLCKFAQFFLFDFSQISKEGTCRSGFGYFCSYRERSISNREGGKVEILFWGRGKGKAVDIRNKMRSRQKKKKKEVPKMNWGMLSFIGKYEGGLIPH